MGHYKAIIYETKAGTVKSENTDKYKLSPYNIPPEHISRILRLGGSAKGGKITCHNEER